jgi:hypothetical protein
VVTYWNPQIVYTPDPTHGGKETPGIAGRVYFVDEATQFKASGEGAVVVDLYDPNRPEIDGIAVPLGEWRIDSVTLQRLLRKDMMGWGYTLFLPWPDYKPEFTRIQLRLRFEPAKGGLAMYADSQPMTLNDGVGTVPVVTSSQKLLVPADQPALRGTVILPDSQPMTPNNAVGTVPVVTSSQRLLIPANQPALRGAAIQPAAGN